MKNGTPYKLGYNAGVSGRWLSDNPHSLMGGSTIAYEHWKNGCIEGNKKFKIYAEMYRKRMGKFSKIINNKEKLDKFVKELLEDISGGKESFPEYHQRERKRLKKVIELAYGTGAEDHRGL